MGSSNKTARSTSYPSLTLEEGLKKLQVLKNSHGVSGEYDREATAKGMGYTSLSGSSARAVAALVQFGLLDRSKDQYFISDLGKKYLMPIDDGSVDEAIKDAALRPTLLKKIYDEYKGQPLPGQLKNILTITYGIQGAAAETAFRVIKQTFKYSGLLSEDGTLVAGLDDSTVESDAEQDMAEDSGRAFNGVSINSNAIITTNDLQAGNFTEQGINLAGDGWRLTVLLKTTKRHSPETRKSVRALLEKADEVADALYEEDAVVS